MWINKFRKISEELDFMGVFAYNQKCVFMKNRKFFLTKYKEVAI